MWVNRNCWDRSFHLNTKKWGRHPRDSLRLHTVTATKNHTVNSVVVSSEHRHTPPPNEGPSTYPINFPIHDVYPCPCFSRGNQTEEKEKGGILMKCGDQRFKGKLNSSLVLPKCPLNLPAALINHIRLALIYHLNFTTNLCHWPLKLYLLHNYVPSE